MTYSINCPLWLSVYECQRVECALTSPGRTGCGMFVMCCMQCMSVLFLFVLSLGSSQFRFPAVLLIAASHHIPTGRYRLHEEPVPADILDVMLLFVSV